MNTTILAAGGVGMGATIVIIIVLLTSIVDNSETKMTYSELINKMEMSEVSKVEIAADGTSAYVTLKGDNIKKEVNIPSLDSFMDYANGFLKEGSIELSEKSQSMIITILSLLSPFGLLISVIIGVTNIIPFFGPFLGAIPSLLLIVLVDPLKALYFLIFVLVLQQVDGNVIGPKILGNSTGLSSFWVIFAITFFGGVWGVVGMIVGVPIFAVVFAFIKSVVENRLVLRDLPPTTSKYLKLLYIDADSLKMVNYTEPEKKAFENITSILVRNQNKIKLFEYMKKNNSADGLNQMQNENNKEASDKEEQE